jgi:hypothetical protein
VVASKRTRYDASRKRAVEEEAGREDDKIKRQKMVVDGQTTAQMQRKSRPTLRGLTVGTVQVGETTDREVVAVWGLEFPSWLPCLEVLGLRARIVFVRSNIGLKLIQRFVDAEC